MRSSVGRAIGSRYELEDEIGRGAFGAVWRGRVRATGEPVAIKVLLEEFAADADVVTRFLRERAALVGLNHRSLVRLRDLVVEGDILALVMQLVEGPDLKKYLAGRGRLEPEEAGLLVAEVAEGMAVAHSAGIIHRDIKPANVLLEQADGGLRPLLTDFGIARIADAPSVTRTHQVVGTPYYLAPEVVAGKKATPAADVYAAGVMLYELITGHPVFRGPDAVSVFRQHMNTIPERPAEIPSRLWPVVAAALVKEPEARPTALVLAAQLRAAVGRSGPDGEPTHQLPVEERYGTLRLPPIQAAAAAAATTPVGDVSMPTPSPRTAEDGGADGEEGAAAPRSNPQAPTVPVITRAGLPQRPSRPVDGKIAGWDAPSDPDAIGAGVSRRPGGGPAGQQGPGYPAGREDPQLPTAMRDQLHGLHRPQNQNPPQNSEPARQRLQAYPPQPTFAPQQGYQQPGPQGYQGPPAPGQPYGNRQGPGHGQGHGQGYSEPPYQPSNFQAAAPPRPVAYTPNQPPVMPRQQPREAPQRQQPQVVQKTVVKHRVIRLGCLFKLALLGAIAFGIYVGVNWVTYKINHFDINHWLTNQWHSILTHLKNDKKAPTR